MGVFIRLGHRHVSWVLDLTTHKASLEAAPDMYEKSEKKQAGCIEVGLSLCGRRRQSPQQAGGQTHAGLLLRPGGIMTGNSAPAGADWSQHFVPPSALHRLPPPPTSWRDPT